MTSPAKKPTPLEEDPKDSSFGTRANAMLNMHLSRSANGHGQPPSSGSSLILDRSIRDSLISTPYYDESMEMDFETKQKDNRERLNALAAFAAASSSAGSYERPPSLGSLPPPPRTKRPGSSAGPGQQKEQSQPQQTPRTPAFEKDMQDELKKAMFAPVLDMGPPSSRSRTNSLRRNSTDTIPEEDDVGSSIGVGGGRGSSLGRHGVGREVLSIRTSIDEQGRVSIESSNRGDELYSAAAIPFPGPGSLLPPADLDNGVAAGGAASRHEVQRFVRRGLDSRWAAAPADVQQSPTSSFSWPVPVSPTRIGDELRIDELVPWQWERYTWSLGSHVVAYEPEERDEQQRRESQIGNCTDTSNRSEESIVSPTLKEGAESDDTSTCPTSFRTATRDAQDGDEQGSAPGRRIGVDQGERFEVVVLRVQEGVGCQFDWSEHTKLYVGKQQFEKREHDAEIRDTSCSTEASTDVRSTPDAWFSANRRTDGFPAIGWVLAEGLGEERASVVVELEPFAVAVANAVGLWSYWPSWRTEHGDDDG
ncbi:hypothetical protein FRC00_012385 [Tulasnella sp. 408]|nr:hypothetical protein FRC00_012385 [Tulasnella sp. 408]